MEESSEAQMDTDVSSSTDLSEVQEVHSSGSHGDMETVIVVEEMRGEDWQPHHIQNVQSGVEENTSSEETTSTTGNNEDASGILEVTPQKTPQLPSKPKSPQELQLSPKKDALVVRTYSRSPTSILKDPQISSSEPDQSSNKLLVQQTTDLPTITVENKDLRSPIKDQSESVKKSPTKIEPCKDIQPITDKEDSPSKVIAKKDLRSPPKDPVSQKSPMKPEQLKDTQPLPDTPDSSNMATPKKVSKSLCNSNHKPSRSFSLKSDSSQDLQPQKEIEDSNKMQIEETEIAPKKQVNEESLSEELQVSKPENTLNKNNSNDSSNNVLENPLLLNALAGIDSKKGTDKTQSQNSEENAPIVINNSSVEILPEKSSDSALEPNVDSLEVHNKSISRELKSLIKSAKESKIISECTQLTTKTRKSRGALDTSSPSISNTDPDRPIGSRRSSDNSLISNSTEKSERSGLKRSMRSQNPEFVNKVKLFLNSVTGKVPKSESDLISEEEQEEKKVKESPNDLLSKSPKKKKPNEIEPPALVKGNKIRSDPYCWRCHWAVEQEANDKQHPPMMCTVCPRSFHYKCLTGTERSKINSNKNWVCSECLVVLHAESSETRSPAMKKISLGSLCELLKYALARMMDLNGVEPFMQPVDRTAFPDYEKYVVHPMDLLVMKNNINDGLYGSTEAFLADAQWILHNSIIFNTSDGVVTVQSKLTAAARALVRSCKAEMGEIEACPECYSAAHSRKPTWFTDVCSTPHILLWAKLKGFPYWPAKCMSVSSASLVDVRFFGAHDRAWVPARDCFLFCEKDPNNFRTKRQDILDSMQEAEQHIRNISRKYGKFVYPPFKTQLDPTKLTEQLKIMIPSFEGEIKAPIKDKSTPKLAKNKSRSSSKGSKGSSNDGEMSDNEDSKSQPRKMADGAEIAMVEDVSVDKDISMTSTEVVDTPKEVVCRKRRRSEMEEAVITILEGPKEKRTCVENKPKSQETQSETKLTEDKPQEEIPDKEQEKSDKDKDEKVKITSTIAPLDDKSSLNNSPTAENKRPPIKMILKTTRCFKTSSPKEKHGPTKPTPFKVRVLRIEKKKSFDKDKQEKAKSHKRRNSKNKSLNPSVRQAAEQNGENKTSDVVDENSEKTIQDDSMKTVQDESTKTIQDDSMKTTQDDSINIDGKLSENDASKTKENGDQTESEGKPEGERIRNTRSRDTEAAKENNTAKSKEPVKTKENGAKSADSEKLKETNGKINKDNNKTRSSNTPKFKETVGNIHSEKNSKLNSTPSPRSIKERIQFDEDNTSLAVIARESSKRSSLSSLPTISSVRSLSSPQTVDNGKNANKVVETNKDSSIFTPTSTDTVRNMKDAVTKLNKLRTDTDQSLVGRVGVCAFARMPSTPPAEKSVNKTKENVEVEVKTEPVDFDDADRQVEKLHLMKAFSLRPVSSQAANNLREVRINKITAGPASRKPTPKPAEPRSRAKKSFPQQKKGEEGRSDLNSKNSMVYIPIQPPVTQAPVRMVRPPLVNGTANTVTTSRANVTVVTSSNPVIVSPPSQTVKPPSQVQPSTTASPTMTVVSVTSNTNTLQTYPTGPIPTSLHSVHTVPLITSVNGQWTFSLQPIMSVGGLDALDEDTPTPLLNGLGSMTTGPPAIMPASNGPTAPTYVVAPKPGVPNTAAPTNTPSPKLTVPPLQPLIQNASPLTLNRNATEENAGSVGEPPRLQHKPLVHPLDASAAPGPVPPPSTAGPLTAKLNQNAIKLTDFFRTLLEDTIERLDSPAGEVTALRLQLEEARWRHRQELDELKHNHELVLAEMRATFEKERVRAVNEARRAAQLDLEAAVKLAKSKQWCANCSQEAQFYCCWNTSYCDYGCQRAHWAQHYAVCMQQRTQDSNTNTDTESNSVNSRLQPSSDNLPKTTAAPALSKAPMPRVFNQEQQTSPKSIIVSMVEDRSGNTTVKCVGTYKPANTQAPTHTQPAPPQMPIIINKSVSMINNDDVTAKKVVTSGGYLIVGTGNTTPLVTPPRRPQTIQYFS